MVDPPNGVSSNLNSRTHRIRQTVVLLPEIDPNCRVSSTGLDEEVCIEGIVLDEEAALMYSLG